MSAIGYLTRDVDRHRGSEAFKPQRGAMKKEFVVSTQFGPVSGIVGTAEPVHAERQRPLLIAIHGGTVTSKYFDVPGYSMVDAATRAGFDIVAIDRPGYRQTVPLDDCADLLHQNAARISVLIPMVVAELGLRLDGVMLIGHSMGGVIATTIAANKPAWPLVGIAGSGFAQHLPGFLKEAFGSLPQQYYVEPPPSFESLLFGPPETLNADMPEAARVMVAPIPRSELIDIGTGWAERAPGLCERVEVPVYYKLAEHEQLWDPNDMQAFADLYTRAPRVVSGPLKAMGHCSDFNRTGHAYQKELLDFAASIDA